MAEDRRDEISAALHRVHERLGQVSEAAGRDRSEITVIAVTKTRPASDVRLLAELGVTDVGENRHQEGLAKHEQIPALGLRWHHIGFVCSRTRRGQWTVWADVVHGLDRRSLVAPLALARPGLEVLIQVSLDGNPARGGCAPHEVPALSAAAVDAGLQLRGVMAVAPMTAHPADAFAELARVSALLRQQEPTADWISAGMSGDWEHAVKHGATHLRLGSVLLGGRPPVSV